LAPSTLGSFLRSFTWGNVRQADSAGREFLTRLARQAPLLPGAGVLAFVDTGSTQKRVYGHKKQGAKFGHTKIQGKSLLVRGLNALAATVSTPLAAPVIAGVRLRGGNAGSAWACGATGTIVVRMDSAFCATGTIAAVRRAGARFSVTIPVTARVRTAIAAIPEDAWQAIEYPQAVWDDQLGCWTSDAEVAETVYEAFTSKKKALQVTARLIVRRVRAPDKKAAEGQGELFTAWRYHAILTDSPLVMLQAEEQHRDHAIVEQVFADWNDGPLAHLPSGDFNPNAAWTMIAAIAQNLMRTAEVLAGPLLAKARAATIRRDLINLAARVARRGRGHLTLHLPEGRHREQEWQTLWTTTCGPPAAAA